MRKIKVLLIAGNMHSGGIENQLMHLLRQADKEKFQIDFTTYMDNPNYKEEIESLGGKCIKIPETRGYQFRKYCKAIKRVMQEGEYDIVHSHELFHSGMVLKTAKEAGVKRRFVHAHNWSDGDGINDKQSLVRKAYNRTMQKMIRKYGTDFCACSTLAGKFLYGDDILTHPDYHLLYNSVDTKKFLENYDKNEEGEFVGDGWINVIQVGRFTPVKRQLFTCEVAKELKARGKKIRFLCAGNDGDDYEKQVRDKIAEYGLEDYVKLLGIRKDIDVLMRKSSAFFLPSLYEGMPLVLIEAQASGLPCVVADTFSREVDYNIGTVNWLKLDDSVETWTNAVIDAVTNRRPEKQVVVDAVNKYGFDSRIFAQKLCDIYEESMDK